MGYGRKLRPADAPLARSPPTAVVVSSPAAVASVSTTSYPFNASPSPTSLPTSSAPSSPELVPDVMRPQPSLAEERRLISLFFALPYPYTFIHRRTLLENYPNVDPLLIAAICSVVPSLCHEQLSTCLLSPTSTSSSKWYFDRSIALTSEAVEKPSLERLQAVLILVTLESKLGNINKRWQRSGIAANMALALQLDIDPDQIEKSLGLQMSWVEKETRRRCWWACFLIEHDFAFNTGRASFLKFKDIAVEYPCRDDVWLSIEDPQRLAVYSVDPNNHTAFLAQLLMLLREIAENWSEDRHMDLFERLRDWTKSVLPAHLRLQLDKGSLFIAAHGSHHWEWNSRLDLFVKPLSAIFLVLAGPFESFLGQISRAVLAGGDQAALRTAFELAGYDARGFWIAADAAVAIARLISLLTAANVALTSVPISVAIQVIKAAAVVSAVSSLLLLAPTALADCEALGYIHPEVTPHLYDPDLPARPYLAALLADSRAYLADIGEFWPVASNLTRHLDLVSHPSPEFVAELAAILESRPRGPAAAAQPAAAGPIISARLAPPSPPPPLRRRRTSPSSTTSSNANSPSVANSAESPPLFTFHLAVDIRSFNTSASLALLHAAASFNSLAPPAVAAATSSTRPGIVVTGAPPLASSSTAAPNDPRRTNSAPAITGADTASSTGTPRDAMQLDSLANLDLLILGAIQSLGVSASLAATPAAAAAAAAAAAVTPVFGSPTSSPATSPYAAAALLGFPLLQQPQQEQQQWLDPASFDALVIASGVSPDSTSGLM
ncbi:hypothetical protein HK405_007234 [Cladochytrium tenue]|nr:hypothetical protein HK405_007234 [Cladochytrium tenue]